MIPQKLKSEIELWMREKRYGHLQINFSAGRIINVNRVESVRIELIGGNNHFDLTNQPATGERKSPEVSG